MWSARAESALRYQAMVGNTGLLSRKEKAPLFVEPGPGRTFYHLTERMIKRGLGLIPWGWTGPIPESITTTIHFFSFQPTAKENCCAVVSWIFVLCFLEQAGLKLCTLLVLAVTTTSWFWFNFWSGWGESESAVREGAGLVACSSQFQHALSHPPPSNGTNFTFNQLLHLALHCRFAGSKNTAWMMVAVFDFVFPCKTTGSDIGCCLPTITRELIGILTLSPGVGWGAGVYQVGLSELPFPSLFICMWLWSALLARNNDHHEVQ